MTDTFYVNPACDIVDPNTLLLRAHTSPVQIRAMEQQPPPIYIIVPGRAYRPDLDATHTPQFHQVEGLAVEVDSTLADFQGTRSGNVAKSESGRTFFPFTEPSVEVDVSCFRCITGVTKQVSAPPLCKVDGRIEILGAGMVDPNAFEHVRDHGYDPEKVNGFAFGIGVERIAMLKHSIPDLRLLNATTCASWSSSDEALHRVVDEVLVTEETSRVPAPAAGMDPPRPSGPGRAR